MPSKSSTIKTNENDIYEDKIQQALRAVTNSGLNHRQHPRYSLRRASEDFGVKYTTLRLRWKGGKTRSQVKEERMILTQAEEAILVEWTRSMGSRGLGWSPELIMDAASKISGTVVGGKWFKLFCRRHASEIKFLKTRGLEACRAQSLNRPQTMAFFGILGDTYNHVQATADCIYNMDEKGVQLGAGGRKGVLVGAEQKTAYHIENGNREMATCIECVCADGSAVKTMHIYKAQTYNLEWGRDNPLDAA